ncbi:serine hydrolase-domain-containing protein [Lophiotrema nucula]|uniref:Serine hydrolase-domain-containing protein n=1 Tax=Lophiotrema nucula TaxID=690887 RepID=A0A6A5ZIJ3_9PLEO|nr:serine hydrolase-domain-containing protein [Lophiotrema nucula]
MTVRILCLHGMGSNAAIFAQQTSSFRSLLATDHEMVFLEAPNHCEPSPEVSGFYPAPYLCWYDTPTTEKVAAAHKFVLNYIERRGPFDGVIGFSQGAALAASILLHHQLSKPTIPPPFSFAIFFGSPIPFSHSLQHGIDTRTAFGQRAITPIPNRPNCPIEVPRYLITDPAYLRGEEELKRLAREKLYNLDRLKRESMVATASIADGFITQSVGSDSDFNTPEGSASPSSSVSDAGDFDDDFVETFYQMFHHTCDKVRIDIPTGHVYGRKDKWLMHSKDLVNLCGNVIEKVEHGSGHDIPRGSAEEFADLVETVIAMSM